MSARTRLRSALDGLGPYVGGAVALTVFALLAFLLTIQSRNDMLLWTGGHVTGVESGGVVRYDVGGDRYTHVTVSQPKEGAKVDVYYDKSDPFTARLDSSAARAADVALTAVPLLLAAAVMAVGVWRRSRMRNAASSANDFGTGLDSDLVRRLLEERRRPPT